MIKFLTKSLNICRELGNRSGEGLAVCNLGSAFYMLGQYDKAIEFYTKSLNISRERGDRVGEGRVLGSLGATINRKNVST